MTDWLHIHQGDAPLVIAFPHGGTGLGGVEPRFQSAWLARRDADWWIAELYAFARDLGATTIATEVSRSLIDVNRDPSGASLYPGMATTELCPTTTFDGDPLYRHWNLPHWGRWAGEAGSEGEIGVGDMPPPSALRAATSPKGGDSCGPEEDEIAWRRKTFFDPYHAALRAELERLRGLHPRVVLYDAHSIRSRIPRLFEGELPQFNLGTNDGATCDPALEAALSEVCAASGETWIANGRFKGGWTTRHYGRPETGVHAVQMELAQRGYMDEPELPDEHNWPGRLHQNPRIEPTLRALIVAALAFAQGTPA